MNDQQLARREERTIEAPEPPRIRRASRNTFRLLPLTLVMMVLMLGVRGVDLYQNGMKLRDRIQFPEAYAEEEAKPAQENTEGKKAAAEEGKEHASEEGGGPEGVELAKLDDEPRVNPKERKREFTQIELDLLQSLSERRDALEAKKREVDLKEKLLQATEMRINDKISEIKRLKEEMQTLLKEYNQAEDSKVNGLVKIYESMKPKDAAKIFNELEMHILLDVVDKMSARKVAPVLASMDPMKAKDVTRELAEFRRLRDISRGAAE